MCQCQSVLLTTTRDRARPLTLLPPKWDATLLFSLTLLLLIPSLSQGCGPETNVLGKDVCFNCGRKMGRRRKSKRDIKVLLDVSVVVVRRKREKTNYLSFPPPAVVKMYAWEILFLAGGGTSFQVGFVFLSAFLRAPHIRL